MSAADDIFTPRKEAARPQYVTGAEQSVLRGGHSRFALAFQFRPVDLARLACTCFAQGACPVCKYWLATAYARSARRASA